MATKKTTALAAAERALASAERDLEKAAAERDRASDAYAGEMSETNLAKLRACDDSLRGLHLAREAREKQLARARAEVEAERRAELEARLVDATSRADVDAAYAAVWPAMAALLDLDRAAAPHFALIREVLRAQRAACEEAAEIAAELGEGWHEAAPLKLEDVRPLLGVAVHASRADDGREKNRLEALLAPIGPTSSEEDETVSERTYAELCEQARKFSGGAK